MAKGEVRYRLTLDAKDFQSGIKVATKEFEGFVTQLGSGAGSLGKVAGAMGPVGMAAAAAMGVAAAGIGIFVKGTVDAAAAAVEFAGKISDLSTKTGIGGEALQKLGFAGSLVGTSMEDMGTAVAKMQQKMVKAPEDFKQLGLSMEKLRALAPEKQFEAVGRAIQSIQDPAQRTAATINFMGKGGQEAMKALSVDIEAAGKQAEALGIVMNDSTRQALDALGDSVTVLGTTWDHLLMNFGGAIASAPEVKQAIEDLTKALGNLSKMVLDHQDDISNWAGKIVTAIRSIGQAAADVVNNPLVQKFVALMAQMSGITGAGMGLAAGFSYFGDSSGKAGSGTGHRSPGTTPSSGTPGWVDPAEVKKQQAARERALKEAQQAEKEHLKFLEKIRHESAMVNLKEDDAFWKKQVDNADRYGKKLLDNILRDQAATAQIKQNMATINELAMEQEIVQLEESSQKWLGYGDVVATVAANIGGTLGAAISSLGGIFDGLAVSQQRAADNLRNYGSEAMTSAQKTQALASAIQGVFAAYRAGQSAGSPGKGAMSGAAKGAAVGTGIMPGWGTLIGAGVGAVAGWLGGKSAQKKEIAALQADLKQVQIAAQAAGISINTALNPKNATALRQEIDRLNKALATQAEAQDLLNDAMEKYGITVDQLGPKFRQQKLDEQAGELLRDWELLNAAGVDHLVLGEKLGPAYSDYVNTALKAGAEIPKSMKPIIDDLGAQGKLLHENGEAYTQAEIDGLKYGETMTEQFKTLIEKITELVNALLGIPSTVDTQINIHRNYSGERQNYDGSPDGDGDPTTALASGFEGMVTSPRKFLVGEAGPEYLSVTPSGRSGGPMNMAGVESLLRSVDARLARLPETLARTTRDAVLVGRA